MIDISFPSECDYKQGVARDGAQAHIAGINVTFYTRLERRLNLLCHQQVPIDTLRKERMLLDLFCAIDSQSSERISSEKSGESGSSVGRDLGWECERIGKNFLIHFTIALSKRQSIVSVSH